MKYTFNKFKFSIWIVKRKSSKNNEYKISQLVQVSMQKTCWTFTTCYVMETWLDGISKEGNFSFSIEMQLYFSKT